MKCPKCPRDFHESEFPKNSDYKIDKVIHYTDTHHKVHWTPKEKITIKELTPEEAIERLERMR